MSWLARVFRFSGRVIRVVVILRVIRVFGFLSFTHFRLLTQNVGFESYSCTRYCICQQDTKCIIIFLKVRSNNDSKEELPTLESWQEGEGAGGRSALSVGFQ